ncbi:MAG: hypothetical protein AVDCRST_MAG75-917 [uncultured Propionibacteriaceae bacterium]|uniref:Esterase-like activity of phytase family protein n=1 Tax=uncultured Propionibacteriaceae bacterium TaxID=257457 RepID=A0A6J4N7Z6_9ACTN|nr:MAG: hypothetical protein AVDCRST_MAG75-917 [uncultured Propionibacteriaceae bacterium]
MTRRARRGCALAAGLVVAASAGLPTAVAADPVEFTISAAAITESSGLARDTNSRVYWTANDSGGVASVYALARDGSLKATVQYRAKPVDVEAVAMSDSRLYVGDIGDNGATRDFVTVYAFDFPVPRDQTVSYQAYDFSYPDGPHDAETLLVDGRGRIYIVTKEAAGGIYAAPAQPSRQRVNRLQRVGDAPSYVTDGVFMPDQQAIALRTYLSVEMLAANGYAPIARAPLPLQPQGESLTVSLDGTSLLAGSEGAGSKVYRVEIPTEGDNAPTGGASPPSSTSPGASPSPSPSGRTGGEVTDEDPNAGRSRAGTWSALGLAAVVALVAGIVVAVARKR